MDQDLPSSRSYSWSSDYDDDETRPPEVVALLGGIKRGKKVFNSASDGSTLTSRSSSSSSVAADGSFVVDTNVDDADGGGDDPFGAEDFDEDDMNGKTGRLKMSEKLAYGLPNLATSAMYLPTAIHINKFFADTLMVPPGTLALATALARGFDTLLDPFFGWLSDNTNTRWGRRKPYIAFSAPLNALFYFLLFSPPVGLSPSSASLWFGVFFALYLVLPMALPHHALGPELTLDYAERSSLYAYSEVFSLVGVIAAAAAPGILSQYITDTRVVFFLMSATIAILLVLTYSVLLYVIKEPVQTVNDGNPLVPGLRRAWRNIPFRVLVITSVVGSIAHHCSSLMFPFYISYVLHPVNDAMWLSVCLLCYFGSSALSIPAWCYLAQHWDKKVVWLAGWAVHLPSSLLMFFLTEGASYSLLGLTILTGLSFGGSSYLYKAIQADAIDYDELRTTRRREGQYITFWALIPKLVAIPAASIPLVILESAGYVANRHPQAPEVVLTIRIMTTLLPCVLSALALYIATHYPINRTKVAEIQSLIVRRRRAIRDNTPMPRELDPITGEELPQISGGLTVLTSEFCWFLDYFSESELRLVLREGQKALIRRITLLMYAVLLTLAFGIVLAVIGTTGIQVFGVMLASLCGAVLVFHGLRLKAAHRFDEEKIRTFRKGKDEYFLIMIGKRFEEE